MRNQLRVNSAANAHACILYIFFFETFFLYESVDYCYETFKAIRGIFIYKVYSLSAELPYYHKNHKFLK